MYNRQTKDNKKWYALANLTNVYNSDNIHQYLGATFLKHPVYYTASYKTYHFDTLSSSTWQEFQLGLMGFSCDIDVCLS